MAAREAAGFVTPLRPVEAGSLWLVFESRGTYEFMVHPRDASHYLEHGITVDGKLLTDVIQVGEWPMIGAWQIRAADPEANLVFTPSVRVGPAVVGAAAGPDKN